MSGLDVKNGIGFSGGSLVVGGASPGEFSQLQEEVEGKASQSQVDDIDSRVPSAESGYVYTPISVFGGDMLIWHDGTGIDLEPSQLLIDKISDSVSPPTSEYADRVYAPERKFWTQTRLGSNKSSRNDQILYYAVIGDSWSDVSSYYLQDLRLQFNSAGYDFGPSGYIDISKDNNGWAGVTNTRTGTWTVNNTNSPLPSLTTSTATSEATFNIVASVAHSVFRIVHLPTSGVIEYGFNGTSWQSVTLSNTSGYTDLTPTTASATLYVRWVSGTVSIGGVDLRRAGKGITWHKLARSGSDSAKWTTGAAHTQGTNRAEWVRGFSALNVDVAFVMLGTNDATAGITPSQYAANLTELVSRIREAKPGTPNVLPGPDIIFCPSPDCYRPSPIDMKPYLEAAIGIADTLGATVFNLTGVIDPQMRGLWDTNAEGTTLGLHPVRSLSGMTLAKTLFDMNSSI